MNLRVKGVVREKGPGFRRIYDELGGLASVSLGVQGDEARMPHQNSKLPIGAVAAIHELGLSGGHRTRRSWLSRWMDDNESEMAADAKAAMRAVVAGLSRKKAMERLGFKWAKALRDNIDHGGVKPPLKPSTIERKGHPIPMLESGDVRDAITYRIYLPRLKGGEGTAGYAAGLAMAGHPLQGVLVKGSPQPPKGSRAVRVLKIKKIGDAKNRSKAAYAKTLRASRPKARKPKLARQASPRAKKRGRAAPTRARISVAQYRGGGRRGGTLLKWLLKVAKKALRQTFQSKSTAGYRNHGFTKSGKGGRTGRAGFR